MSAQLINHFRLSLLRVGRAIHRRSNSYSDKPFNGEPCPACGFNVGLKMRDIIWPELALQWKLTPAWANWMNQREGLLCRNCGSNLRSRQLAKSIVDALNTRMGLQALHLDELCGMPKMQTLSVAEINAAGHLHPFLTKLPRLSYSEYGSNNPAVPSEDLQNLTYPDASFDLIVNSDVLEHVPDPERALAEIRRVLKPDGLHIFSVPVIWNQKRTRCRAEIRGGQLVHLLPPSHHGSRHDTKLDFLVFQEFGQDFIETCERIGWKMEKMLDARNPSLVTFVSHR